MQTKLQLGASLPATRLRLWKIDGPVLSPSACCDMGRSVEQQDVYMYIYI